MSGTAHDAPTLRTRDSHASSTASSGTVPFPDYDDSAFLDIQARNSGEQSKSQSNMLSTIDEDHNETSSAVTSPNHDDSGFAEIQPSESAEIPHCGLNASFTGDHIVADNLPVPLIQDYDDSGFLDIQTPELTQPSHVQSGQLPIALASNIESTSDATDSTSTVDYITIGLRSSVANQIISEQFQGWKFSSELSKDI